MWTPMNTHTHTGIGTADEEKKEKDTEWKDKETRSSQSCKQVKSEPDVLASQRWSWWHAELSDRILQLSWKPI